MLRCLLCGALAALALAPAALADGPALGAYQDGTGVVSPDGTLRYLAVGDLARTTLLAVRTEDGKALGWANLRGGWGIPAVTLAGAAGGLSADGRTLVLGETVGAYARSRSVFRVLEPQRLRQRRAISLPGDFSFDALSPDGRTLYLVQHISKTDASRYVVRSVDLASGRLRPGWIADKTQTGWVMQGWPLTRATSAGGRWVYTLYQRPGGTPFVHALDTVDGVAHCIGIPWQGDQDRLWNLRLSVPPGGGPLALRWRTGRPFLAVDRRTYRVVHPQAAAAGGFPWWPAGLGAAAALALLAGGLALSTRHRTRRAAPAGA